MMGHQEPVVIEFFLAQGTMLACGINWVVVKGIVRLIRKIHGLFSFSMISSN